jgi:hypothetical protein
MWRERMMAGLSATAWEHAWEKLKDPWMVAKKATDWVALTAYMREMLLDSYLAMTMVMRLEPPMAILMVYC